MGDCSDSSVEPLPISKEGSLIVKPQTGLFDGSFLHCSLTCACICVGVCLYQCGWVFASLKLQPFMAVDKGVLGGGLKHPQMFR